MNSKIFMLDNGLKLVFCQDNTKHVTLASLFVKFGGGNKSVEVDGNIHTIDSGMAHFLEHLLIEHSKYGNCLLKFKEKHTFSNGYTNKNNTEFFINSVVGFEDDLTELINMVNCPVFSSEDVEETKKAIIKEKMMAKDNKFVNLCKLEYECLFENIKYPNILGEISDIENIDYDKVKFCYDTFYQPSNQVLIISGNFNLRKIKKLVKDVYKGLNKKKINFNLPRCDERDIVVKNGGTVEEDVHTDYVRISYKINIGKYSSKERIKLEFYLNYFLSYLFDSKSSVYNNLVEEKISLYNISYSVSYEDKFFVIQIGTGTDNHDKFVEKIVNAMKEKNICEEDFILSKKQSLIELILREDNLSDMIIPFINNIMIYNYDFMDTIEDIEEQNFEEYKSIIEKLDFNNYIVSKLVKKKSNDN